jgi:hypothetical protein
MAYIVKMKENKNVVSIRVSNVGMVRFKIRFYDFVVVSASDHSTCRTRFMMKNANLP